MEKSKLQSLLVYPETNIKQAMCKLSETAEKILFVVDKNKCLVGTLTDGDIRSGLINGLGFNEAVEKVMCLKFYSLSLSLDNRREEAKKIMQEHKIDHVPIVDDNNFIVDAVSWSDIFGVLSTKEYQMHSNPVVIMAGGKGLRMDPFTKVLPKPLVPIGEKPIIEFIMENFYKYGFSRFIYTLNYKKEYIKLFLKEFVSPYAIEWVEESSFLDTAGSIRLLKDKLKESFFVINCDSLFDIDLNDVLQWHKQNGAMITVVGCHGEVKVPFGVLQCKDGCLESISEKPVHDVMINTGLYIMEPSVISFIKDNEPIAMNILIERAIQHGKVTIYPVKEGWLDIGQWQEYKDTIQKIECK